MLNPKDIEQALSVICVSDGDVLMLYKDWVYLGQLFNTGGSDYILLRYGEGLELNLSDPDFFEKIRNKITEEI